MTELEEARDMIRHLAGECDRAARFIRSYDGMPYELRAWASRIESKWAPNSVCAPAIALERAASDAREFLQC